MLMSNYKTFIEAIESSKKIASFDFDNTLVTHQGEPIWEVIETLLDYSKQGYKIVIVTARHKHEGAEIDHLVDMHELPVEEVHFTSNEMKGPLLKSIGADVHIDDDHGQLRSAEDHGIEAIHTLLVLANKNEHYEILKAYLHRHL